MSVSFLHDLDVSALEPPEPFERCMERVPTLGPGEVLRLIHRREPFPLYDILDRLSFAHATFLAAPAVYHVLIWRRSDALASQRANSLTPKP